MAPPANVGDWDYTNAQWMEISAAIKRVRPDPLGDTERDALRITAKDYFAGVREHSVKKRQTRAEKQKAWEQASKLISDLQDAIKRAAGKEEAYFSVSEEMLAAILGKPQPSAQIIKKQVKGGWKELPIPHFTNDSHTMSNDELAVLLSQLKYQIDDLAQSDLGPPFVGRTAAGPNRVSRSFGSGHITSEEN
jgi:hypothetical protein